MALLTSDAVDVLCHSAVRARNGGVLMTTCSDSDQLAAVSALVDDTVTVTVLQVGLRA